MLGEIAEESDRENPNAKTAFVYKHNDTNEVQHDEDEVRILVTMNTIKPFSRNLFHLSGNV